MYEPEATSSSSDFGDSGEEMMKLMESRMMRDWRILTGKLYMTTSITVLLKGVDVVIAKQYQLHESVFAVTTYHKCKKKFLNYLLLYLVSHFTQVLTMFA